MENTQTPFEYIKMQENAFRVDRVPLTRSKSWSMYEHIERCTNVANAWFNRGSNEDGLRPYNDIVTPIIDVAFRSEGFDVKDIVPFVNDSDSYHLSLIVKKYHPQWARKNELDTFIDEVVENSIIYDLVVVKDINNTRPEVIDIKTIAFCDQTDIMAGPICIKHNYTIAELVEFKGKWDNDKIDQAIVMSLYEKKEPLANDQSIKTPGKYVEVYELRGNLPESWIYPDAKPFEYCSQMHIVCYYTDNEGKSQGITLYKGKDKPLSDRFKTLKIDTVRSKGRACGRSIVERLFEPQVWNNYAGIKLKEMIDNSVNLLQTDSEEYGNQKISSLKNNTILKHEPGRPISRVDMNMQNIPTIQNFQIGQENQAQKLGSASDASLGKNPVSGTPFSTTNALLQQGEGTHEYRQGKIATFFSDVLYRDLILGYLVKDLNKGDTFSEVLSLDELQEVAEIISNSKSAKKEREIILSGRAVTREEIDSYKYVFKQDFLKGDSRKFFKEFKDAFKEVPIKVFVNISSKQKNMAANADKLSNLISTFLQAGIPFTGMSKAINELLENSGLSPINFSQIVNPPQTAPVAPEASGAPGVPETAGVAEAIL